MDDVDAQAQQELSLAAMGTGLLAGAAAGLVRLRRIAERSVKAVVRVRTNWCSVPLRRTVT
ncbi:MAG: hypothetical protein R2715_06040 [Ilumatobacteraceae bacterium]